jgi:hypothetical protein
MADDRLKEDAELEAEAKRLGDYPLHPLVKRVTNKLGAFNLIRNARNKNQVEIERLDQDKG